MDGLVPTTMIARQIKIKNGLPIIHYQRLRVYIRRRDCVLFICVAKDMYRMLRQKSNGPLFFMWYGRPSFVRVRVEAKGRKIP